MDTGRIYLLGYTYCSHFVPHTRLIENQHEGNETPSELKGPVDEKQDDIKKQGSGRGPRTYSRAVL